MKKKIMKCFLVLLFALFLAPHPSSAFLEDWYLDIDGAGGYSPTQISEYLDIVGPSWVQNTFDSPTSITGTFHEWGAFNSTAHDGGATFDWVYGDYELTAITEASGTFTLGGDFIFDWGYIEVYSQTPHDFATTNGIYGADNGTPIATFELFQGWGTVDPSGVPNGEITLWFESTFLAAGYWFDKDMNDLSLTDPIQYVLGYSTTNASYVVNPTENMTDEIIEEFAGVINWTNDPPWDLVVSTNGQFRIDVVPEPATMILVGFGLLGMAGLGRKKFFNKN